MLPATIITVDNGREIYLSIWYWELRHVGQPLLIWFVSPEISLYYIWHLRTNFSFVWTIFPCTSAFYKQPIFTHDPADHLFGENVTLSIQNGFDSTVSISFLVIVKDGRNNLAIVLVLFCKTQTFLLIIVAAFGHFKLFEQYRQWIFRF